MDLDRQRAIAWLEQNVSAHRLEHILGVEMMAINLAKIHQLDARQAAQAGLLHDLAKFFPPAKLLDLARQHQLNIDEVCRRVPHLLHADVGAIIAKEEFGVKDPQVLRAIANHTLGQPQMDDLSCVIFLADALEPGRGDSKKLNQLRQTSQEHLLQAVRQVCDMTLKHLVKNNKLIHPRMVQTRNWAFLAARP
ncbi:MAG: HD domain-containing protein [Limnothrix sp. RL_2_0]|nr:HD domain-containing protein [Limnothrix sp. RL_2_0]